MSMYKNVTAAFVLWIVIVLFGYALIWVYTEPPHNPVPTHQLAQDACGAQCITTDVGI